MSVSKRATVAGLLFPMFLNTAIAQTPLLHVDCRPTKEGIKVVATVIGQPNAIVWLALSSEAPLRKAVSTVWGELKLRSVHALIPIRLTWYGSGRHVFVARKPVSQFFAAMQALVPDAKSRGGGRLTDVAGVAGKNEATSSDPRSAAFAYDGVSIPGSLAIIVRGTGKPQQTVRLVFQDEDGERIKYYEGKPINPNGRFEIGPKPIPNGAVSAIVMIDGKFYGQTNIME